MEAIGSNGRRNLTSMKNRRMELVKEEETLRGRRNGSRKKKRHSEEEETACERAPTAAS